MDMNKIFSIKGISSLLLMGVALAASTSCSREEADLFDKSAAERLNEVGAIYTQRFAAAEGGWIMEYYPDGSTVSSSSDSPSDPSAYGYLMCVKFNADGSAKVGMNNAFSGGNYKEDVSAWEVITDLGPVLTFNSYNQCLHKFSDPASFSNSLGSGSQGVGCDGDYEFVVIDLEEGQQQAMLKGKKRGTYDRLTQLPAGTDFKTYLEDVEAFRATMFPSSVPNYNMMTIGDSIMKIRTMIDGAGLFKVWPANGDETANRSYKTFLITKRDGNYYLRFRDALAKKEGAEGEQEFKWVESANRFEGVKNAANTITGLSDADTPDFFNLSLANGTTWQMTQTSEMSDAMRTLVNRVFDGFPAQSSSFALQSIDMKATTQTSDFIVTFNYKQGRSNATMTFKYSYTKTENGTSFVFVEPTNANATKYQSKIDGVQDFLDVLAHSFSVSSASSGFNLNQVRLTQSDNSANWFVLGIKKSTSGGM